jgi:hypothetical protein
LTDLRNRALLGEGEAWHDDAAQGCGRGEHGDGGSAQQRHPWLRSTRHAGGSGSLDQLPIGGKWPEGPHDVPSFESLDLEESITPWHSVPEEPCASGTP